MPSSRPTTPRRLPAIALIVAVLTTAAVYAVSGSQPAAAQTDEALSEQSFADEISVGYVLVPVLVRDRAGRFRSDLTQRDFDLSVDGDPVPIHSFERGREAPLSVVVLQDLSGSMANGGKLDAGRQALTYLLEGTHGDDELAVATFAGGRLTVDVPFTTDRQVVGEAIGQWEAYGTTALHDAVAWIPEISGEGRHPKRAVLLVTDGIDNASTLSPEEARRVVENAHLPVYVLGLGSTHADDPEAGDGATYARLLRQLARVSGGGYYETRDPLDVRRAVTETLEHLRQEYVLGFPSRAGRSTFRRIEVLAEGGRHQTLHRMGYTGGPPEVVATDPSR